MNSKLKKQLIISILALITIISFLIILIPRIKASAQEVQETTVTISNENISKYLENVVKYLIEEEKQTAIYEHSVQLYQNGTSLNNVILQIIESGESNLNTLSNEEYIKAIYNAILLWEPNTENNDYIIAEQYLNDNNEEERINWVKNFVFYYDKFTYLKEQLSSGKLKFEIIQQGEQCVFTRTKLDIQFNNGVNANDALMLLQIINEKNEHLDDNRYEDYSECLDVNDDGIIDTDDISYIAGYVQWNFKDYNGDGIINETDYFEKYWDSIGAQ